MSDSEYSVIKNDVIKRFDCIKTMNTNVNADKLKVYHSLMSSGTFVIYIVHPMCLDGHIKIVSLFIKIQ